MDYGIWATELASIKLLILYWTIKNINFINLANNKIQKKHSNIKG